MSEVENFFSTQEEQTLIQSILVAEKNTSGEIRIHIEKETGKAPMDRALEVFYELNMNQTELRNGVLIYIAIQGKKFAILGDEGINNKVPDDFWDSEKELIHAHFAKGEFTTGLELAILEVGKKLKEFFPYQSDDTNELSDEISKG